MNVNRKEFLRGSLAALIGAGIASSARAQASTTHYKSAQLPGPEGHPLVFSSMLDESRLLAKAGKPQLVVRVERYVDGAISGVGVYTLERTGPVARQGGASVMNFDRLPFVEGNRDVLVGQFPKTLQARLVTKKSLTLSVGGKDIDMAYYEPVGLDSACFLTTACTVARGLPDTCAELTAMRQLRDEHFLASPEGAAVIDEYYRTAPGIVALIYTLPNRAEVWDVVYQELVLPAASMVERGQMEQAATHYLGCVEELKAALI